jgi:uncharacterized protein (DUF2147 family)
MRVAGVLLILLLTHISAWGGGAGEILGTWKTERGESLVEIFTCGARLCGKVVWLKDPLYGDSRDGPVGQPVSDRKNPDPALRSRPIIGLRIMEGFTRAGENNWGGGTCYDPKSGKSYRGKIRLTAPDRLELRGYVGMPLFGRSSVWTR